MSSKASYYAPTYHVWHGFEKDIGQLTLRGHSVSARSTGFYIPQWRACLDAGIALDCEPLYVFLTHGHSDHCGALTSILTGNNAPVQVYVPANIKQLVIDEIIAKQRLTKENPLLDQDAVLPGRCAIFGVQDGDIIDTPQFQVRCFATFHKVSSIGFAFYKPKKVLKQEYRGMTKEQLLQIRQSSAELNCIINEPLIAYVGDSTTQWIEHSIFQTDTFKTIVCECTFIGELENDLERAKTAAQEHGHTCWEHLKPIVQQKARTQFILCHWSQRYLKNGPEQIDKFFQSEAIENVFAWTW